VVLSDGMLVIRACMYIYLCVIIFPAIESNEECTEEGGVFEYQEEEDQGLANHKLDAYLNPIHLLCRLHKGLLNCMFFYCYSSCSNYIVGSSSTSQLLSSFEMTPLNTYSSPFSVVACWIAAKPLENL
jgi:hypothetical protein